MFYPVRHETCDPGAQSKEGPAEDRHSSSSIGHLQSTEEAKDQCGAPLLLLLPLLPDGPPANSLQDLMAAATQKPSSVDSLTAAVSSHRFHNYHSISIVLAQICISTCPSCCMHWLYRSSLVLFKPLTAAKGRFSWLAFSSVRLSRERAAHE